MGAVKKLGLLACCLILVLPAGACGGDDSSDGDEAREAREQGRREGRSEQRLRELERELRERKREGDRSGGGGAGPAPPASSGGSRDCGGDLSANSNTSCDFARIVKETYQKSGQATFEALSPVTGKTYTMSCTGGSPHVCTGGNNAAVYFP